MLSSIKSYFTLRIVWLTLATTALILEFISLYLQHIMYIKPCVICIYQRCALYGIIISGLIGAIAPKTIFRQFGLMIWIYSAWKGLILAKKHNYMQLNPSSPFITCDLFVNFPSWLPLDTLIPEIFNAYGNCIDDQWFFLSLEISQWMIIIFGIYLSIAISVFIIQFIK